MMLTETKLQQNNLTQQFVHTLTEAIVREQFNVGDPIPSEGEIAAQLGISRTIVREGMREISALGLISKRQGARSTVVAMENWDLLDKNLIAVLLTLEEKREEILKGLFSLRLAVECQAAAEAAVHRTDRDLDQMQAQLATMEQTIADPERFLAADDQMHRAIHTATHNVIFYSTLKNIRDIMAIARNFTIVDPRLQQHAMDQHCDIVIHIKDGNPDAANEAMKHHILWAIEGSDAYQHHP